MKPNEMIFGQRKDYVTEQDFKEHKSHYTEFVASLEELYQVTKNHDCSNPQLLANNYIPFVGLHCTGCRCGWGIHVHNLNETRKIASPEAEEMAVRVLRLERR
jgi:hypothetical protein